MKQPSLIAAMPRLTKLTALAGPIAVYALLLLTWLLIALAKAGWFMAWPLALPLLVIALVATVLAWWRQPTVDRWVIAGIVVAGSLLYTPPAEHLPLFGDAAIYVNEAAYLTRTGGLTGLYEPLVALSPAARASFYVANTEQFPDTPAQDYAGILYGGYYLTDLAGPTMSTSRLPLSAVWLALWMKLVGVWGSLYNTALWGIGALVVLYWTAKQLLTRPLALWAVALLGVSYPQIHFTKAPYSEVPGQFWTLLGIYFALRWIEMRRPWQLATVLLCWTTAWSGRIDALLLLSGVGLLGLMAATWREGRSLRWATGTIVPCVLLGWLALNQAYVGATYQFVLLRWPWFGAALLALTLALAPAIALFWLYGRRLQGWLQPAAPFLHLLLFAGALFVVGWSTIPNPWRTAEVMRRYQEIIWFTSAYITPLYFWLALVGVGWLFRRGYNAKEFFLLALALTLSALFFMNYTVGPYYPVAMRRLISDVLPLLSLLAAVGLAVIPFLPLGPLALHRTAQGVLAVAAIGWMGWLSWPVIEQREANGSLAFVQELHDALPAQGVFLFETQDGDSWVGWLAAPLYSFYGDWALHLDSDTPDPALLAQAVDEFRASGRTVYLVSQSNPPPAPLLPPGYQATVQLEQAWVSSLIGQTRTPYPPPYWEFTLPLYLFALERE